MLEIKNQLKETIPFIKNKCDNNPKLGIILGTGMGKLADKLNIAAEIPYSDIPHFVTSTVESHSGELLLGEFCGIPCVAMKGRFHFYEGYSMKEITYPVRVMKALGVEKLIISNAAGGLNPIFNAGDIMLISDHINLMGDNPLRGQNDDDLGVRFPDMSGAYTKSLRAIAIEESLNLKQRIHEGVYLGIMGPNLETPAEYRFIRKIGADAVGMSTVPEVIVAVHAGLDVLAFSIITDMCLPDALEVATLEKILKIASKADEKLSDLIYNIVNNDSFMS